MKPKPKKTLRDYAIGILVLIGAITTAFIITFLLLSFAFFIGFQVDLWTVNHEVLEGDSISGYKFYNNKNGLLVAVQEIFVEDERSDFEIMISKEGCEEVTCECAKNTIIPCMVLCYYCEGEK